MADFVIETPNLWLRHLTEKDAEKIYHMSIEASMKKWIPNQVYETVQEAAEVVKMLSSQYAQAPAPEKAPYVLGVVLKSTGVLIGHVGLSPVESGIEMGYAIEEKFQGFGFATEGVTAMSSWALDNLNLQQVLAVVGAENQSSCRVLEKSGFELLEEKEMKAFGRTGLFQIYVKKLPQPKNAHDVTL